MQLTYLLQNSLSGNSKTLVSLDKLQYITAWTHRYDADGTERFAAGGTLGGIVMLLTICH